MKPWICEDSELGGRELGGNTVDDSSLAANRISINRTENPQAMWCYVKNDAIQINIPKAQCVYPLIYLDPFSLYLSNIELGGDYY